MGGGGLGSNPIDACSSNVHDRPGRVRGRTPGPVDGTRIGGSTSTLLSGLTFWSRESTSARVVVGGIRQKSTLRGTGPLFVRPFVEVHGWAVSRGQLKGRRGYLTSPHRVDGVKGVDGVTSLISGPDLQSTTFHVRVERDSGRHTEPVKKWERPGLRRSRPFRRSQRLPGRVSLVVSSVSVSPVTLSGEGGSRVARWVPRVTPQ